jgi:hypothetical protein
VDPHSRCAISGPGAFYSAKNEAAAKAKGVKRVCNFASLALDLIFSSCGSGTQGEARRSVIRAVRGHDFPPPRHRRAQALRPSTQGATVWRGFKSPPRTERSDRAPATTREPAQEGAPDGTPAAASSRAEIDTFLSRVNALGPAGRYGDAATVRGCARRGPKGSAAARRA